MQNDTVIWQIINHSFCSFKASVAKERTFCQNEFNVSGLCIRSACPLANSKYATIREHDGICYLYQKTVERAHTPNRLWEKIKLPANYTKALDIVSTQLEHFPKYLVHRNKQRLTKIHQMLIRMRKLKLKARPKIVTTNTKVDRREKGRERHALQAAQLDNAIESELLERLKQVVNEGEIYNYPETQYRKVLNNASSTFDGETEEAEEEEEDENFEGLEGEVEYEDEMEDEDNEPLDIEYVEDFEISDDEDGDMEDIEPSSSGGTHTSQDLLDMYDSINEKKKRKAELGESSRAKAKGGKKGRVEIEYEEEREDDLSEGGNREVVRNTRLNSSRRQRDSADYNF